MKALILYALFVSIGAVASGTVGYFVEREFSSAMSLIVFLTLFFANFVVSWLAVVLVMDGSLRDVSGEREQHAIEATGRKAADAARAAA